jgi:hypothetical protein
LWSARLNPDSVDLTDALTDTIGNDYMGITIGPDDTPWAAYYHSTGFAGRLSRGGPAVTQPSPAPSRPSAGSRAQLPATGRPTRWGALGALAMTTMLALRRLTVANADLRQP